ncbi:cupin domain-containing protein [Chitinimonas sp.]|uniref:cupin domain-containing protein n=1 Tax=Chitinimonas sp. TaxID=1934313 RepID=UPI002F9442EA
MTQRSNSANADGVFEPFHISEVPWQEFSRGERFGIRYQHLSTFGGGSQVGVAMEVLPPGKQANQAHYHMLEEEHLLVLEGSLTLQLGEVRHILGPGHYVCFPAGQKVGHALVNHTAEPCRYLVLGSNHPQDVAVHTDTGRVSVKLMGQGYDGAATRGYWDGVDDTQPS